MQTINADAFGKVRKLADAARAPFLSASLVPAIGAGALAFGLGNASLAPFALALAAVGLAHVGTNMSNDYYDYIYGNYPLEKTGPTGGSFAIQAGAYAKEDVLRISNAAFIAAAAIFAYLGLAVSPLVAAIGFAGILVGFFYTAPPFRLGYNMLGEIATFLGMGPLLAGAVFIAAYGAFSPLVLPMSAFFGFIVLNVLLAAQVPDIGIDKASGKKTISSMWGAGALQIAYGMSCLAALASLAAFSAMSGMAYMMLAALPYAYFALPALKGAKSGSASPIMLSVNAVNYSGAALIALMIAARFAA
ncbi:MAG: prenyltransferase [Candidatus Micrarchaeia archaeon]